MTIDVNDILEVLGQNNFPNQKQIELLQIINYILYKKHYQSAPRGCPSNNETPLEDWIDGQTVMQALHISPRTLQTLRTNGTLPYSRIGNKLYYRKQDILKILSDNYTMFKIRNNKNNS